MGRPLAKAQDDVVAIDTHIVLIPTPAGPTPTPQPLPFRGPLSGQLSSTVMADEKAAATVGSTADAVPPHMSPAGPFQRPPANQGTVQQGSATVFIDDQPAARAGDVVVTCNDPADAPVGRIVASSSVLVGG